MCQNLVKVFFSTILVCSSLLRASVSEGESPGAARSKGQGLQDFLDAIEMNNPELKRIQNLIVAASENVEVAGSLPDPTMNVGIFAKEIETRVGPQKARLGLRQTIPWKGKRGLKESMERASVAKYQEEFAATKLRLFDEFIQTYSEYYYLGRSEAITGEHLALLTDLEKVLMIKYEAGSMDYAKILRLEVEIDQLKDRLVSLGDLRTPLAAELNAIMGRKSDEAIPIARFLSKAAPNVEGLDTLDVAEVNPGLKSIRHNENRTRLATQLAAKEKYPDFNFGIDWVSTGKATNDISESGKDSLVLSVGINLPIWRKKVQASENARYQEMLAIQNAHSDLGNRLTAQLKRAQFEFEDSVRKITLYETTIIPKAREALNVTHISFESNQGGYLDLIDAERVLLNFELALQRSIADRMQSLARIDRIRGGDFSFFREQAR